MNKKDNTLKKMEMDLLENKKKLEAETLSLHESETDFSAKLSGLAAREEVIGCFYL